MGYNIQRSRIYIYIQSQYTYTIYKYIFAIMKIYLLELHHYHRFIINYKPHYNNF